MTGFFQRTSYRRSSGRRFASTVVAWAMVAYVLGLAPGSVVAQQPAEEAKTEENKGHQPAEVKPAGTQPSAVQPKDHRGAGARKARGTSATDPVAQKQDDPPQEDGPKPAQPQPGKPPGVRPPRQPQVPVTAPGGTAPAQPGGQPGGVPAGQPIAPPAVPVPTDGMHPTDMHRPVVGPDGAQPPSPTTALNIPPSQTDVPAEQRKYVFGIKDGTYEQLVEGFARQTGLGVLGEAPKDGKVTFVSTQELSFNEALSRIRMLLFNYKPLEPYWMRYEGTHLRVLRINDLYRELRPDQMFKSVDDFIAANLPDDELALVIYTPKEGSIADLRIVRDFLPDYVRVAPANANSVTIFALVKDIKRYLEFIEIFVLQQDDPRTLERIEVKHVLPSEAVSKLQQLMDIGGGGAGPVRPQPVRAGAQPSPVDTMADPPLTLLPDDVQGVIIVRAMRNKLAEIHKLLPFIDVDTSAGALETVVIPVENADPGELVATLQQILQATASSVSSDSAGVLPPPGPAPGGGVKPGGARAVRKTGAMPMGAEGVTMIVHPSQSAIIVVANAETIGRVRNYLKQFDVPGGVGPVKIPVLYGDLNDLVNTVVNVLGTQPGVKGQPVVERFGVVPDGANNCLWFRGTQKDLDKVRDLIAQLDVAAEAVTLRTVRFKSLLPSFVASMLREFDQEQAAPPVAPPPGKPVPPRAAKTISASKFTPNDDQGILYVLCTDAEWEHYKPVLQGLEGTDESTPPYVKLTLQHMEPQDAADQLAVLASAGDPKATGVRFVGTEGGVFVIGADKTRLEAIQGLLAELDRPITIEQRTFEIRYGDPPEIKIAIDALIGGDPTGQGRVPRPVTPPGAARAAASPPTVLPSLTVVQLGNRLIVQATPKVMAEVATLIAELDVETGQTTVKVYKDFPPGANIESIADSLADVFSAPTPPGTPPRRGFKGPAEGPRFMPRVAAGELVVIADPTLFPRIEELLEILRKGKQTENYVVEFIDVAHTEPEQMVELMIPLLDLTARQLVATGVLREATGPEQLVQPVLPGSRRPPSPGEAAHEYFHLDTDLRNRRLVIAAPKVLVDEARKLAFDLDKPGSDLIFRTVHLKNADPAEMVSAVREMAGGSRRSGPGRGAASLAKPAAVPAPAAQVFDSMSDGPLSVFEAPGGGAIVLHGPPKDVERAVKWIEQLDAVSTRGRMIRVYKIHSADVKELAELILNMVDLPVMRAPTVKVPAAVKPPGSLLGGTEPEIDVEWETTRTWHGQEVFLRGDFVAKTLIVGAPPTKMSYIDEIIKQFDPEDGKTPLTEVRKPKVLYDLVNAEDADDAAWSAGLFFDKYFKGEEKPEVEAGFGSTLIISHSDESKLPEIVQLIREKIDVADPEESRLTRRTYSVPSTISTEQAVLWLMINHPEVEFELEAIPRPETDQRRVKPLDRYVPAGANPCVLPLSAGRAVESVLTGLLALQQPGQPEGDPPVAQPPPAVVPAPVQVQPDFLQQAGVQLMQGQTAQTPEEKEKDKDRTKEKPTAKAPKGTKLRVEYRKEDNTFKIEGPNKIVVEDVKDWLEDLEKELENIKVKPDIRIYRLTYIDVETAADVLEEMFNATRQQREMFGQQQQVMNQMRQQQQLQQQQQQRLQQQQPGQPPGRGQPGAPGRPDQPPGQQPQPQMPGAPQLPATSVRVYPYPREHALILRADTSDYPIIEELLDTIDRPKPIDSEFKIFALKKLNAVEVEETLVQMLGLDGRSAPAGDVAPGGRRGTRGGAGGTPSGPEVPELPRTLMQPVTVGEGELNVDPKDIKLSSNEAANTILVMAPKRAIEFIGGIIEKLESEDMPERIPKHYELKFADAEEVADYLSRHYEESPGGGGSRKGGGGVAVGAAPAKSLNTPSFVPYPRLNLLTVLATIEQHQKIDEIITRLDVKQAEKWEDVPLINVDAKVTADTLDKMFGSESPRAAGPKGGAAPAGGGGQSAKFVGDEGGRILFFSAPESLREPILATIQKLEEEAKGSTSVRVIELKYSVPSKVAEAIDGAYRGGPASKGQPRPSNVHFTISSHDPSKRLFVKADDATFGKIESLAKSLDKPAPIGVELRVYPLQFANARQVHTQMTKMLKDYLPRLGPGAAIEAFSVEADDRANALVALGNETVFKFLEETLPKIDTPASATGKISFMMYTVKSGDAGELAQNIQALFNKDTLPQGETPPQVNANRSANVLMIRGTEGQLAEIRRDVIEPYEKQAPTVLQMETIQLKFADAEAVAESINKVFEDYKKASDIVSAQGPKAPARQFTVIVTPDANTKQVTVHASAENMGLVKARIAELDRADVAETIATTVRIYPVKFADANAVVKIIADWSRSRPQPPPGSKKQGETVIATAEPVTKSVVVTTSHSNHLIVQEMIAGLDKEESFLRGAEQMKSFRLGHADPAVVQDAIMQLFKVSKPGQPPVIAVADSGSRSVLVSASPQDLLRIEDLISKIDTAESSKLAVHVIKIQNAGAESVARVLSDMYKASAPRAGGTQSPAVTISALQGSQAVLVKCDPKDLADIAAIVKQLDSEGAVFGEVTKIIPLLYGDATEAQQALEKTLKKPDAVGGRGGELLGDARVSVLAQSNAVVVSGTKEVVARIEGMVKEWDDAGEKGSVPQIIQLKHVNAGQIASSLQDMFTRQPATQRAKAAPVILPDEANRTLLVRASAQDMVVIESLVAKMDVAGMTYENFVLVQVAQGTDVEDLADKVETSVNESAQRRPGQSGRDAPSLTATPDRRTNSIILAGSPSLFADARQLIQAMEKMTPPGGKTIRVISADTVPLDDVKRLIDQLQGDQQGRRGGGGTRPSGSSSRRPRPEPARPGP